MKNIKGKSQEAVITLKRVRLSYCHLWEKGVFQGKEEHKFSTILLLDNDDNAIEQKAVRQVIQEVLDEKNKGKPLPPDKLCLRDGGFSDKDGYDNTWFISAKSEVVKIIGADKKPISKTDGLIYSGAYVNATISLWFQNNENGKRVNCQLRVVQFCEHGDPLGGGAPTQKELDSDLDEFEDFAPEEELEDDI